MSKISERINQLALPVVTEEGCELWDVEYIREAGTWFLRVYIDKENGVSIDDCERISRRLDPLLDEADVIPDSYVFEVCSAGADRVLKRPSDFEKFMGSQVELRLYQPMEGRKVVVGELAGYNKNGEIKLLQGDKELCFPENIIALVKLHVTI